MGYISMNMEWSSQTNWYIGLVLSFREERRGGERECSKTWLLLLLHTIQLIQVEWTVIKLGFQVNNR